MDASLVRRENDEWAGFVRDGPGSGDWVRSTPAAPPDPRNFHGFLPSPSVLLISMADNHCSVLIAYLLTIELTTFKVSG